MKRRLLFTSILLLCAFQAHSQGWSEAYGRALELVDTKDWAGARGAFKEAIALRPEDQSAATSLPGSSKKWRSGSPYSPNFGAAVCLFRTAMSSSGPERTSALKAAAVELETLLAKGQLSLETYFFLNRIYSALGDPISLDALSIRFQEDSSRLKWKIDAVLVNPEDRASMESLTHKPEPTPAKKSEDEGPTTTVIKAEGKAESAPLTNIGAPTGQQDVAVTGRIPAMMSKFALVVGNGEGRIAGAKITHAATDAIMVRDALILNAGFDESNVDVVTNASADQLRASVAALAERIPQDATVLIFFTGLGANIAGKDYYAGIDAETLKDSSHMVAVGDVYKSFLAKGASIFAFNQVGRPINSGLYFGRETPLFGRISQAHATIPGAGINSLVSGGLEVGAYAAAFTDILADFRSNQIPIMEFAWQVFYRMRRGGGPQTPTLPVLTVISADARF